MEISAKNVTVTAGGKKLLASVDFELHPGELVALLGPNGAGKTTLLRALLGFIKLDAGCIDLGGDNVQSLSPIKRALRAAYLPQTRPLAWPNIVYDVVALGRYSHGTSMGNLSAIDVAAVQEAIEACDIAHLASRKTDTLSGGELARVHCARAFAAQAPLLIADEPVAALDLRHQYRVMELLHDYVAQNRGVLTVLHDVNLAAKYADRLVWMKDGIIHAVGSPEETLTPERLAQIYGVQARVDGKKVTVDGIYGSGFI